MNVLKTTLVALALSAPLATFAQTPSNDASAPTSTVTRAQVRQQLVELEKAGYNPSENDISYPNDLQAAEARVDAAHGVSTSVRGTTVNDPSLSSGPRSVFFGH